MMEMDLKINLQQVLQIHNNDTNQDSFLIEKDGKWIEINEEEYNQLIEANKNE